VIVERPETAEGFLLRVAAFLLRDEAAHNLIIGIGRRLAAGQRVGQGPPLFTAIGDRGKVVGAALWTPPWRVVLSMMPRAAALALAEAMHTWGLRPPGAVGPVDSAHPLCERLALLGGGQARVARAMRAFELRAVSPAPPTPGFCRRADPGEAPLVASWYAAFWADAQLNDPTDPREAGANAVREGRVFLWDDRGPASLASVGRTTPGGASLGPVYTPLERRRRGYATALVAAVSDTLLGQGHRFCCLFTDLANPVSNAIYPRVGYRPVCDFAEVDLVAR
jgi:GNAT superfamily N-acetyltransferase